MNPVCRSASRKDMEAAIQKWLGGPRDREGGRKQRMRVVAPATAVAPATDNRDDHDDHNDENLD